MARAWHISWIVFSLSLVAVTLAGCPRRPVLAPSAGVGGVVPGGPGAAPPSPGVPPAGAPGTAQPAPSGPVATAPTPGTQPGPVAGVPTPAPLSPGAPSSAVPGPAAGGPSPAPAAPETPAAPSAPSAGAPGTVTPAVPSPKEFVEAAAALRNIYFDFDKTEIRPADVEILGENARWLKANAAALILIEGHCDERGTNEYNLALGERRARETRDYLVSRGGAATRLSTNSDGEERPVCIERTEACWAQNRRAHFLVKLEGR